MDISNKTSDKNVAIEKDIERCKQLTKPEHASWIGISNQLAIVHILAEREQDKKRIQELEERQIVGMTVSDKNVAQDIEFLKSNEADALYFRGNPKLKSAVESVLEKNKELEEVIENSIPTQKVENKLEELKNNYDKKYDLYMGYKVESREQQDILKQMSILQELLEGEK